MRSSILAVALAITVVVGCDSQKAGPAKAADKGSAQSEIQRPRAPLTDITAVTKLDAVRMAFNAHKGEARFLTLLSPT